jgi:hypothetical protein
LGGASTAPFRYDEPVSNGLTELWERFAPVDDDPALPAERSFARLFDPAGGWPDAALVVAGDPTETTAYLVRPGDGPRLVGAEAEPDLLFGALPELVGARRTGEWREIPAFVPRSLRSTAEWVVMAACLRGWPA